MIRRAAAAAAVAILASPALAAAPKGTAGELAAAMMPRKAWAEGMQQIAQGLQAGMESHPGAKLKYPPDFGAKVRGEVEGALPYDALLEIHAKELGATFTETELKELLAFYRSPVGQKSLDAMPAMQGKIALQAQQRVQSKMPEIMERLSSYAKGPGGASAKDEAKTKESKAGGKAKTSPSKTPARTPAPAAAAPASTAPASPAAPAPDPAPAPAAAPATGK